MDNEIDRYSHFEYYVQTREASACWRPTQRCSSAAEAMKYIEKYGKENYKGEYHGHEMRAVEFERVTITRLLKDNK